MSALLSWVGKASLNFTNSPDSIVISQKEKPKASLAEICRSVTPPCWLNPLLFNGHLQTIWTALQDVDIPVYYKRRIFEADDQGYAGTFAVDFAVPRYDAERDITLPNRTAHFTEVEFEALGGNDDKPMVICLHGLSGGSYEIYLRAVLKPLFDANWEGCVINARGCAMSSITTGVMYNARATWDIRQMVKWIRRKWPNRKLFGIGFSLGANILTNYIGEEGSECLLEAAVVCSNPWCLDVSNLALQRTWIGKEIYSKAMGRNMRKLYEQHAEQISTLQRVDPEKVRKVKYLHEFDRVVQCPTWGYPTEGAYYRDHFGRECVIDNERNDVHYSDNPARGSYNCSITDSTQDSLFDIKIPLFAINAEDDPIVHKEAIPWQEFQQNPYLVLLSTSLGGHLSWFEIGGTRWFAKPASNFLMKMAEKGLEVIKPSSPPTPRSTGSDIVGKPSPFFPTRRKLKMSMDV